jgi:ketosteroid isomerase-like protein
MDAQQVRQLADRFIDHLAQLENGAADAAGQLAAMFADDAELTNPAIQHKVPARRGRDDIQRFWQSYRAGFRDLHSEFVEVLSSDHAAGLFWKTKGVNAKGQPVSYDGVSLLTFDANGKIARFQGYYDSRQIEGGNSGVAAENVGVAGSGYG